MANENLIQTIQTEISKAASTARFNVQGVPYHIHNSVDAPYAYQPVLTYVGTVETGVAATPLPPAPLLAPKGWTFAYQDPASPTAGQYVVIHNLNTTFYSVVVTPYESIPGFPTYACADIQLGLNDFTINLVDTKTQAAIDHGFTFLLTNVNNKTNVPVQYVFNG